MCNQAVCLVAAELERRGISTVVFQLLRMVAEKVKPPRAIWVPYPHGWTLGAANDPERQHEHLEAALRLLEEAEGPGPVLVEYGEASSGAG